MHQPNFHTKMTIFDIFIQIKHIPSKAMVAQWVHHFMRNQCVCCDSVFLMAMGCLPMGLLFDLDRKLSFGFGLCVISILLGLGPTGLHMLKRAGSEENNWVAGVIVGLLLSSIHFLAVSYALHMWATDEGTRTTVGLWVSCVCGDDLIQHGKQ